MKAVLDLTKAIKDTNFYNSQFSEDGKHKNILFLVPQLCSRHIYKFIFPYFSFYNENIAIAINSLNKYNPYEQIVKLDTTLNQTELLWADYIIIPFTTEDLNKQYGIYEAIREVNPKCKIVFCVDFNFYDIPKEHPYYELFKNFGDTITNVEKNILTADLCLVSNLELYNQLPDKLSNIIQNKYEDIDVQVNVVCLPYFIDHEIATQNVEFDSLKPNAILKRSITEKIADVADEIKKEDLNNKKKRGRKPKVKVEEVIKKASAVTKKVDSSGVEVKTVVATETEVAENVVEKEENKEQVNTPVQVEEKSKINTDIPPLKVGIICSPTNVGDIIHYRPAFEKINEKFGGQVRLIFIGYDYPEDTKKILNGISFEYIKPVSIIHYFKQLKSLELDCVLIPLQKNNFNVTSENYNKYLEAGLFDVPVIAPNMFPYNKVILSGRNGIIFNDMIDCLNAIENVYEKRDLLKAIGQQAKKDVLMNYTFNNTNVSFMTEIFIG